MTSSFRSPSKGAPGALLLMLALAACPGDRDEVASADSALNAPTDLAAAAESLAAAPDTAAQDLSQIRTSLPPAAPDTFTPRPRPRATAGTGSSAGEVVRAPDLPPAPEPLMAAVRREQAFSRFCYQEFGQKSDPALAGGVAMVVTVGGDGVTDARVANDSWTSSSGAAVNRCLDQRAATAWKVSPGAVRPGRYVVQLTFRGS